jgi:murein L,D-transpeptidase YcbB/YkuD
MPLRRARLHHEPVMRSFLLQLLVFLAVSVAAQALPAAGVLREVLAADSHPQLSREDWRRWRKDVASMYAERAYTPLWFENGAPRSSALAFVQELRGAGRRGLRPADYSAQPLADRFAQPSGIHGSIATDALDVALSVTAARYLADLHGGRIDPRDLGFELDVARPPLDVHSILESMAAAPDGLALAAILDSLEPQWRRVTLLKSALARYRALAGQPSITIPKPLRWDASPGASYAGTPALRQLLAALGDLAARSDGTGASTKGADPELAQGLEKFQRRHGLRPTGTLDERTWRALSVPLHWRVRQIELTLERLRWLPPRLQSPPIIVNIPEFKLFAFLGTEDREMAILPMDVIVGRKFVTYHTPVFAADMTHLIFHPYWDVPQSILSQELLPQIARNLSWVGSHGYEVVWGQTVTQDVDADTLAALASGKARLRQRPGPENALGSVKFVLPNRYSVFLHDTPAPGLFAEPQRAFSHGCIRVSDPGALVAYVLRDVPGWTPDRIRDAMNAAAPLRVDLPRPIRVFIVYATALVAEDGTVHFFEDLYGHDQRLDAALKAHER